MKIIGDVPVNGLGFEVARGLKGTLMKLPANMDKISLFRGKSLEQIIKLEPKPMATATINKALHRFSALVEWAVRHGYCQQNCFKGLAIKKRQRAHEERAIFSADDLSKLFTGDIFRGGKILHPHYYWLPLLGLYSGARLEEICQLHLADIREIDGLWCLDIKGGEGKQIKTASSERCIPIHSELVRLGLVRYVEHLKTKNETMLFPELKRIRGKLGHDVSKWFIRYRRSRKVGMMNDGKKCFHSFRHGVSDCLKQKGVAEEKVTGLLGHVEGSTTFGRYGKAYQPEPLKDVVEMLQFEGLPEVEPYC